MTTEKSNDSSVWTYDAIIQSSEALAALSKIGTKDKDMLKKLTGMIIWAKGVTQEFFVSRDTSTNTWAERDENDEIKIRTTDDGKGQTPVMRNGVEFNLAINELLRGPAKYSAEPPEPFTWHDLDKFQKYPDALIIAGLGPFIDLTK